MYECIGSIGDSHIFSTLDRNAEYCQVKIDPRDREKTVFTIHHGLYEIIQMPPGLENDPASFERAMDGILSSVE